MGWFYLDQADQRAAIDTWKSRPGMKGLRFYFSDPRSQSWPDDGTLDWLWPEAERLGIPVSLQASAFLPRIGEIAERHPALKISIDHMGVPRATQGAEAAYQKLPQLLALARHQNVAVKATGQAGYALDAYPFHSIHDALQRVFDAFAPRRMFWGTDITRMACTWRQCVMLFTEELPWLADRPRTGNGPSVLRLDRLADVRLVTVRGHDDAAPHAGIALRSQMPSHHRNGRVPVAPRGCRNGRTSSQRHPRPYSRADARGWRTPDRIIADLRVPEPRAWRLSFVPAKRAGALILPVRKPQPIDALVRTQLAEVEFRSTGFMHH